MIQTKTILFFVFVLPRLFICVCASRTSSVKPSVSQQHGKNVVVVVVSLYDSLSFIYCCCFGLFGSYVTLSHRAEADYTQNRVFLFWFFSVLFVCCRFHTKISLAYLRETRKKCQQRVCFAFWLYYWQCWVEWIDIAKTVWIEVPARSEAHNKVSIYILKKHQIRKTAVKSSKKRKVLFLLLKVIFFAD